MSLKPGDVKSVMLRLTVPFVGCAYDINDCNQLTFNINMLNNRKPMCVNTPVAGTRADRSASKCFSKVENTDWSEEQFTNFTVEGVGLAPITSRSYLVLANFMTITRGDHAIWEDYRTLPYEVNIFKNCLTRTPVSTSKYYIFYFALRNIYNDING